MTVKAEMIANALDEIAEKFKDKRVNHFQVDFDLAADGRCHLTGSVLNDEALGALVASLEKQLPEVVFETSQIQVFRGSSPSFLNVQTTVTGLHSGPGFGYEMQTQLINGRRVELLEEQDKWVYVRQMDGYLGWVYRPYLTEHGADEFTHMLTEPVAIVRQDPSDASQAICRIMAATRLNVVDRTNHWVMVQLVGGIQGWLLEAALRPLATLPNDAAGQRQMLVDDSWRYIGIPYLWGGTTAYGLDCSGYVQLLHQLAGVAIPRDADMQFEAGRPVEPPFRSGDLLFFGSERGHRSISHVGMSLGGWRTIHSSRPRNGVYTDDVESAAWLRDIFVGARRFLQD